MHVPLVAVATEDRWCYPCDPRFVLAETGVDGDAAALVRRYLAAFGPATVADAQEFSGVPGLRAAFASLRGELVTFADEAGRELFDLPDAPRPGAAADAPVRFLPEFDSLVLAHADRGRVIDDADRGRLTTKNLRVNATVLHDGRVCATWSLARRGRRAMLVVAPFRRLRAAALAAIEHEAEAVARAAEPDAADVRVEIAAACTAAATAVRRRSAAPDRVSSRRPAAAGPGRGRRVRPRLGSRPASALASCRSRGRRTLEPAPARSTSVPRYRASNHLSSEIGFRCIRAALPDGSGG
jgi:hypothetical protein